MYYNIMLYYIIVYITAATALEVDEKALVRSYSHHVPVLFYFYIMRWFSARSFV